MDGVDLGMLVGGGLLLTYAGGFMYLHFSRGSLDLPTVLRLSSPGLLGIALLLGAGDLLLPAVGGVMLFGAVGLALASLVVTVLRRRRTVRA